MSRSGPLLERQAELAVLDAVVDAAAGGTGRAVLIEGEAGIGKTSLLDRARERALERGLAVVLARGGELELLFGHGVARQLFERPLRRAGDEARRRLLDGAAALAAPLLGLDARTAAAAADPGFSAIHGLYWLTVNLAEQRPLAVLVDDVQWSDAESVDWLLYLARRLEGVACCVVLTARSGEPTPHADRLAELRVEPLVTTMPLEPLTPEATARLVERELGRPPAPEFAAACRDVTGGNPFLLGELLGDLADRAVEPAAGGVGQVRQLVPAAVSRSVLVRLRRLGEDARALALAAAVLDGDADVRRASALAALDAERGAAAARSLVAARILVDATPLRFAHPLLRAAVAAEAGALERARLHRTAARLLDDDGERERAALQLLASEPEGDSWAVDCLEAAAQAAMARGAPDAAVRLLRRAVLEPPPPARRVDILRELGTAELIASEPAAAEHLDRARRETAEPRDRAGLALLHARAVLMAGRPADAVQLLEGAIDELPAEERELSMALEAALVGTSIIVQDLNARGTERLERWRGQVRGVTPGERAILAQLAVAAASGRGSAAETIELARRALAGGRLLEEQTSDAQLYTVAVNALATAEAFEEADAEYGAALADARARGSIIGFAITSLFRAHYAVRQGRIAAAEADARAAFGFFDSTALVPVRGYLLHMLVEPLLLRGNVGEAADVVARIPAGFEDQPIHHVDYALRARGLVRLARRDARGALADLLECGRRERAYGVDNPAQLDWTTPASAAAALAGDVEQARALARQAVAAARRYGAPGALATCLRALGRVEEGEGGLALLEEAVELASGSAARLEHAAALADFGAALRRANHRARARALLEEAVELADACGATVLRRHAEEELRATGARPRRVARRGVDALTASERRVASMAADGLTNKEIAQALFVTTKTVETHLAAAFRKLGVGNRRELAAHLRTGIG